MELQLTRPLVVFDIESTGINWRTDRIIDLALVKLLPDGQREQYTFRVNPGMPIPPESTAVHQITDDDVAGCPGFADVVDDVLRVLSGADLCGYNMIRFDLPMLAKECERAGKSIALDDVRLIDAQRIFHKREPRDLTACLLYTSPSPRDQRGSRMPSSA